MSRSAAGSAVGWLEKVGMLRRTRTPGERADRVMIHPSYGVQALESPGENEALAALTRLMERAVLLSGVTRDASARCDRLQ
jgi:hypothetical protein